MKISGLQAAITEIAVAVHQLSILMDDNKGVDKSIPTMGDEGTSSRALSQYDFYR
jgi:hypothetical protein